jgi:lipopolysaccharide/colanic/teichoic acid biosynthesis glycosyltransferase
MEWYWIVAISVGAVAVLLILSTLFYRQFFKRFYDIVLSGMALIVLSPLLLILTVVGAIAMGGNPFFVQPRPGKIDKKTEKEKIFNLIKFRTMSNKKDAEGNLLPDDVRLNKYGKFLRSTSMDELPELISIFISDMSIIGPRPLLVRYLERYNEEQHHRHDVRPGLTGYAQAHGRNAVSWEDKFSMDVWYAKNISFFGDVRIILDTVKTVLKHDGISSDTSPTMEEFMGTEKETVNHE